MLTDADVQRYARQLILPELGAAGQERLRQARVLVVGCGGLGAPVAQYLAAAGVGRMTLLDDDVVEASNLNRQVIHRTADLGRRKVERAAECVRELNPNIEVRAEALRVGTGEARELVREHDVTVDCTDGLAAKYLLNDAAVLEDRHLVHGSATALQGQVLWVRGRRGPCLRCLFETLPPRGLVPTCQQAGVLGATCGVVGSLMAVEALKALAGLSVAPARLLSIELWTPEVRAMALTQRPGCPACGDAPTVNGRTSSDYEASC